MRSLLLATLALVAALLQMNMALGHAAPERFNPAPGEVLEEAPAAVDGWFTQDIRRQEGVSSIQVFDADGAQVDDGKTVIDDDDRRHMRVALQSGLGPGRYVVAYQTLSDEDDEVDGGCFLFFVGQEAEDAAHEDKARIEAPEECPLSVGAAAKPAGNIIIEVPATAEGPDVTVGLTTEGITAREPTGSGQNPKFGHYHVYLDTVPALLHSHEKGAEGQIAESGVTSEQGVMSWDDTFTFQGLKPGNHIAYAAMFYDNHQPFDPPVISGATFTVAGSGADDGGVALWVVIAAVVAAVLVGAGGGWALSRPRR